MKILALELSTVVGSLAWREENDCFSCDWANDRQNSGLFFENLSTFRKKFGLPERIIVGLGPGSYAGTRIAISTAIGLAGFGAQLFGYPSICAMECPAGEYGVIGDARRGSFFFARIVDHKLAEGPDLFSEADLRRKLDTLDENMPFFASENLPQFEEVRLSYPSAGLLAQLGSGKDERFEQPPLEPIYLREPYVTVPKLK